MTHFAYWGSRRRRAGGKRIDGKSRFPAFCETTFNAVKPEESTSWFLEIKNPSLTLLLRLRRERVCVRVCVSRKTWLWHNFHVFFVPDHLATVFSYGLVSVDLGRESHIHRCFFLAKNQSRQERREKVNMYGQSSSTDGGANLCFCVCAQDTPNHNCEIILSHCIAFFHTFVFYSHTSIAFNFETLLAAFHTFVSQFYTSAFHFHTFALHTAFLHVLIAFPHLCIAFSYFCIAFSHLLLRHCIALHFHTCF